MQVRSNFCCNKAVAGQPYFLCKFVHQFIKFVMAVKRQSTTQKLFFDREFPLKILQIKDVRSVKDSVRLLMGKLPREIGVVFNTKERKSKKITYRTDIRLLFQWLPFNYERQTSRKYFYLRLKHIH